MVSRGLLLLWKSIILVDGPLTPFPRPQPRFVAMTGKFLPRCSFSSGRDLSCVQTVAPIFPLTGQRARLTQRAPPARSPDEHPFTPRSQLPSAILPPLTYPPLLYDPTGINVNDRIMQFYVHQIVPSITRVVTERLGKENDDGNYGSAATRDLEALQAISRRIHYGERAGRAGERATERGLFQPVRNSCLSH